MCNLRIAGSGILNYIIVTDRMYFNFSSVLYKRISWITEHVSEADVGVQMNFIETLKQQVLKLL